MTSDVHALAEKLDILLERSNETAPHIFDDIEIEELRRVIVFVKRIDALGWWSRWAFYGVVTVGAILANWERITKVFRE